MTGRLIGVVGPSGVGKDTVMEALAATTPAISLVQRWITRGASLGGEDYRSVSVPEFEEQRVSGGFCIHWQAHGLSYGIPADVRDRVDQGEDLMVNLSRNVLLQTADLFPRFCVLHVTARSETLASRLAKRGRETPDQVQARLGRAARPLPDGLTIFTVQNDGPLETTVADASAQLYPVKV